MKTVAMLAAAILALTTPCDRREDEPNGTFPSASFAGVAPPASRQSVCGVIGWPNDADFWKVHLEYNTNKFAEGSISFELEPLQDGWPMQLTVYQQVLGGGWSMVGNWYSFGGKISTGRLGVNYYKPGGLVWAFAVVRSPVGSPEYTLRTW